MNENGKYYSIVVPVYGCASCLSTLQKRLASTLTGKEFEIIFVDDCSPDEAWKEIEHLSDSFRNVKGIQLSRNFGQHNAITCGLNFAKGDWVIVMDCDLQDVPEEIPKLIEKSKEGYDIVFAKREDRKDEFFKKLGSTLFYKVFGYLTDTKQDHRIANFGIYDRKVVDAVLEMGDQIRYFPTMVQWVGFKKTAIAVAHAAREQGESSYNFKKLLRLAIDNIISFSDKPLRLTIKFGLTISFISMLIAIYYLWLYFSGEIEQIGFTSVILSIWFLAGTIIVILGTIGMYIGRTFEKVKSRPSFIIQKSTNINSKS